VKSQYSRDRTNSGRVCADLKGLPTKFEQWLKGIPDAKQVCLVGHAPSLAQRVRQLLGITATDALKLPKGALACLETENRRTAALKFLITPKLLGVRAD